MSFKEIRDTIVLMVFMVIILVVAAFAAGVAWGPF